LPYYRSFVFFFQVAKMCVGFLIYRQILFKTQLIWRESRTRTNTPTVGINRRYISLHSFAYSTYSCSPTMHHGTYFYAVIIEPWGATTRGGGILNVFHNRIARGLCSQRTTSPGFPLFEKFSFSCVSIKQLLCYIFKNTKYNYLQFKVTNHPKLRGTVLNFNFSLFHVSQILSQIKDINYLLTVKIINMKYNFQLMRDEFDFLFKSPDILFIKYIQK